MWLLNFIPNFIIHLAVLAGLGLLLIDIFFGNLIPVLYRAPARILAVVLLTGSLWLEGANYNQQVWMDRVAELEAKVKIAEEKSAQVNTQIEYKFIDKVKVVHDTQVVIQERIKEVEKVIDAKCEVPKEAIELLNQAAQTPGATK